MLRRHPALTSVLPLLILWHFGFGQVQPDRPILGPDFNSYNADHLPEHDPAIERLLGDMSIDDAVAILQRELAGALFIGLDGEKAEHWGAAATTPESAAVHTLVVDRQGLSWRSMSPDDGADEVLVEFSFEDAAQVWTRFSMANGVADADPPEVTPQSVILYLLTDDGVEDIMEEPIPLSKILPSRPETLPTYPADPRGIRLAQPGVFLSAGRPAGFAVCCFSSAGLAGSDPQLPLERLPLVIAAFRRLAPELQTPDLRGLMLTNPLASPTPDEARSIIAVCNRDGFDNQGVFLCQNDQLNGLAYMTSHAHGMMQDLIVFCTAEWTGNYHEQAKCVLNTMMDHD